MFSHIFIYMDKTCKYCKKIAPLEQFVKILSWRRNCCLDCYKLPHLEKQRKKDECAIFNRKKYVEYYEKHHRKRQPLEKELYRSARNRAKKFGLPFTIEYSDIIIPEFCPVLGIKIRQSKNKMDDYSPTLDRLNPMLGYIKGNVCVMSNRANRIKSNGSIEEHEKVVLFMKKQGLTVIKSVV